MCETTVRAFLRVEGEDLPSAQRWERHIGTLGDDFFLFFLKNIDEEGIWGTLGDALMRLLCNNWHAGNRQNI